MEQKNINQKKIIYIANRLLHSTYKSTTWEIVSFFRNQFFNLFQGRKIIAGNLKLKNIHRGERCFIVGNGPSLKEQDLTLLKDELTFVVNNFHLHPAFPIIKPRYYCIVDCYYQYEKDNPRWLPAANLDVLKEIETNSHPQTTFFLPAYFKKTIEKSGAFKNRKVYYLAFKGSIIRTYPRVETDITKPISGGNFVSFACLFLARYMGFKKIYLLGMDHDWKINTWGKAENHFYSGSRTAENENELKKNLYYYNGQMALKETYDIINELFAAEGVCVFNATHGGYLDAFERANYEELFKKPA